MKMVKSLLLGSAATMIAVAGAQAADLPVKAKAVEYVKVCSLYGAGFYYIPGTDTCIKIGGYIRADYNWQGAPTLSPYLTGAQARYDRSETADTSTRTRFVSSWDVRTQTEYGTLRSYVRAGWQATSQQGVAGTSTAGTLNGAYDSITYYDRAIIQFAGFTFGKAQSFSDFSAPAANGTFGFFSDTGGTGTNVIAYTAQLGNGVSLTVAAEDASYRRTPLVDLATAWMGGVLPGTTTLSSSGTLSVAAGTAVPGAAAISNYQGQNVPDFVANIRVDQAWGSAQLSGALHQVSAGYYGSTDSVPGSVGIGTKPGDKWGWNIRGGLLFNVPTGAGDKLILEGAYSKGASHYSGNNVSSFGMFGNTGLAGNVNGSVGFGYVTDGVFMQATSAAGVPTVLNAAFGGGAVSGDIELTTSWSAYGSFEHYWTPTLRSSVVGGVFAVDYSDTANAMMCSSAQGVATFGANLSSCNFDFRLWQVATRTVWTPVTNLDLSVELIYSKFEQNHAGVATLATTGARPAGVYELKDQDTWSAMFRAQRNFWF